MFHLAHISDIHLAPLPEPSLIEFVSKRITGYVNWKLNRAAAQRPEYLEALISSIVQQNPDHVSITGDLVNLATKAEIERAGLWLEAFANKLGDKEKLTTIAGNHDAYVPGSLRKVLTRWGPYFSDYAFIAKDFPLLRRRNNISIISCNSAEATLPFQATGYFRKKQAEKLAEILAKEHGRFRVVLIHHLPIENETANHKRLIGADMFNKCIADSGAELVLHGHTHLDTLYWLNGPQKKVPVLGVPAAGQIPGAIKPAGHYNLISIDGNPNQWQCHVRQYGFAKDATSPTVSLLNEQQLHG